MKKKTRLGNIGWNPSPEDIVSMDLAAKLLFLLIMVGVFLYPLFV